MKPTVSVIIPCYNQSSYLEKTLESVFNQIFTEWECIVVNDGSTDNTELIAKKWCKKDTRFKYFHKENGGLSSARNFGLKKATAAYIQFLDSDDLIKPEKFLQQLIDLQYCQISISNYFPFVDGTCDFAPHRYLSPFLSEKNFKKEIILDWEYRKSIPCHCVLFEKQLIDKNNIKFNEDLPNHEDWVFWVKLFYFSESIKNNQNELALYRFHNKSMSTDFKLMKKGFLQAAKILQTFFKNEKNDDLCRLAKLKYNEVYNRNRVPMLKQLKSKLYSKLARVYRYVKFN